MKDIQIAQGFIAIRERRRFGLLYFHPQPCNLFVCTLLRVPLTVSQFLFRNRSYTPLPFVLIMLVFAEPTLTSILIGFGVSALGESLRASGVFYVGSETRVTGEVGASKLVTSGPFAFVRNPLYVGNILIYLGIGIMSLALWPWLQLIALVWFVFQYTLIVREEEGFLHKKFGQEFVDYCAKVPRFLFRLTPYQSWHPVDIDWNAGWKSEARTLQAFAAATLILVIIWIVK
jgi:protein-S-isoprenylcysteine O-methyltransferase Ste14